MTTAQSTPALSLADVEAFDPRAASVGSERVTRCPICQSSERAFHFNAETGAYNCKRASCGATGKLSNFWQDRPKQSRRARAQAALNRVFTLPPDQETKPATGAASASTWREECAKTQPLQSTPGASYIEGRGVPLDLAIAGGVRFAANWAPRRDDGKPYHGGAAIVFPLRDQAGALVAASGRYIQSAAQPKARHGGAASAGVFATYGALRCELVTICEAPIDALSLAACGFAAVAANGCNLPDWLPAALAFKRVLIASDADDAGDKAALEWIAKLQAFGARCVRFKPYRAKDFNEALQRDGKSATATYLEARLAHIKRTHSYNL
jgi:uncharacterized protein with GYD domain